MCGIAGILRHMKGVSASAVDQQRADCDLVNNLVGGIRHRGPDDEGIWADGTVALGSTRLSILDLSKAGHQPFVFGQRWVVVFNGEIYNYVELRVLLEASYDFQSGTDTEVLAAAFEKWGANCLERLNGMFAFFIWDTWEKRGFGARDRFGEKPFYFVESPDKSAIAFCSEIVPLLRLGWIRARPNLARVMDFVSDRVLDHTSETMFEGVRQLRPGHAFDWAPDRGLLSWCYWIWRPEPRSGPSLSEAAERFAELFTDAVRIRLRADVPVGVLLSGGVDSSSVFCTADALLKPSGSQLWSFSTRVEPRTTENACIDALVGERDATHRDDLPNGSNFANEVRQVLQAQEEPFADGSMVAHFRLMNLARQAGVKVVLSGQGADEFWDGYYGAAWTHLGDLLVEYRMREFTRTAANLSANYSIPMRDVLAFALSRLVPQRVRDRHHLSGIRRGAPWVRSDIWRGLERGRETEEVRRETGYTRYLTGIVTAWGMPSFLHYEDRNSMHFGVEVRLPFLDFRLAELAGSLTPELKQTDGHTKAVMREGLRGRVPGTILDRHRKEAWPAPIEQWIRSAQGLLEMVSEASGAVDWIDATAARTTISAFRRGDPEVEFSSLWRLVACVLWATDLVAPLA